MDEKMLKKLSAIIAKLPKKDLTKNIEKAKNIIKTSNKEDLKKLLETEQLKNLLGKDTDKLKEILEKTDLTNINTENFEDKLKDIKKD